MLRRSLPRRFAVAVAAAGVLAACGSGSSKVVQVFGPTTPPAGIRGTALGAPVAKPDIRLTDTAGRPYDLRAATAGKLTLLYFGYTHCPDVCPTTVADIAAALKQVPATVRARTAVVFVTSDPARDTAPVLRRWLGAFDPSFVGLTGNLRTIDADATSVGVPLEPPVRESDGSITVDHGAQVLAFAPGDGRARYVYLAGTSVADYAHDLPLLMGGTS